MKRITILVAAIGILLAVCLLAGCNPNTDSPITTAGSTTQPTEPPTTAEPTEPPTTQPTYSREDKLIAFTFDDGPRVKTTTKVLDLLESNSAKATFFVLGENVGDKGTVLRRAVSLGCEIGNHTMNHKYLTKLSQESIDEQISLCSDAIEASTGIRPTLVRAPGGNYKGVEDKVGYPLIQWSIDTNDWRYSDRSKPDRSAQQRSADIDKVAASVLDNVKPGDIILMHDIYDFSADVFEQLLPELISRGYKLVTVSELYAAYGVPLEAGSVYRGGSFE